MSVTAQTPYVKYTAAPAATLFTTTFRLLLASDLVVKVNGDVVTTGFTVSGIGAAIADVTFGTPMVGGEIIELRRSVPQTRATDYQQLGDYQASQVNADFDRIVMMLQDSQFVNNLAVLLPVGDAAAPMTLPALATRASMFLAFDALGNAMAAAGASGVPVSAFIATLMDDANAAAARATLGAAASGANSDITSLGAVTGVTATPGDNTTKLATTAFIAAALSGFAPTVRQTVLSGPVDSNGFAAFGGSVGTATLTASGTLVATCGAGGNTHRTGSITNPAWTAPGGSGTGYLMLAIDSAGVVTTTVRTLLPSYINGTGYSVTNGQFTFSISENAGRAGNGSTTAQVYEVCVGECPYTSGAWSGTIIWYALRGQYDSGYIATLPAAATYTSRNHNIGVEPTFWSFQAKCTTTDAGYQVGDVVSPLMTANNVLGQVATRLTVGNQSGSSGFGVPARTSGVFTTATSANWSYRFIAKRGW